MLYSRRKGANMQTMKGLANTLELLVKGELLKGGPMTFARFMELALYHPSYGYYGSGRARSGKAGDFYTSPHAGAVFGALIAEVFATLRAGAGPFCMVEVGAGEGVFAADFLDWLSRYHPDAYSGIRYYIVERSPGMRARQRATLARHRGVVSWYGRTRDLPGPLTGMVFSNELVDSLPFHRVSQSVGALSEMYVTTERGGLAWSEGPVSTPLIPERFNRLGVNLASGTKTEVCLAAEEWMRDAAKVLERGYIVTVDYGYTAREYYSPERMDGTFLCYRGHDVNEDPFRDIGSQDITAHADFTTLALCGQSAGLVPALLTDQTSFLAEAGAALEATLVEAGADVEDFEKAGRGMKALIHPDWLGGTFKVLVQTKGADLPDIFYRMPNMADMLF